MHHYPAFDELNAAPDYLYITEAIERATGCRIAPLASTRSQETHQPRTYLSKYIGVTKRHGRWQATWGPRGHYYSKTFTTAPEDEERAARYRASVLGLSEPEVRM